MTFTKPISLTLTDAQWHYLTSFCTELHPSGAKNAKDANKFSFMSFNKLWLPPHYFPETNNYSHTLGTVLYLATQKFVKKHAVNVRKSCASLCNAQLWLHKFSRNSHVPKCTAEMYHISLISVHKYGLYEITLISTLSSTV